MSIISTYTKEGIKYSVNMYIESYTYEFVHEYIILFGHDLFNNWEKMQELQIILYLFYKMLM